MHKELLKYRLILPPQIEVMVHRAEEGGYWAKVLTFPGVVAQGEDLVDVIEMVNIAIFDYLEIPKKYRKYLSSYQPEVSQKEFSKVIGNFRHQQIEEMFMKIIRQDTTLKFNKVAS